MYTKEAQQHLLDLKIASAMFAKVGSKNLERPAVGRRIR